MNGLGFVVLWVLPILAAMLLIAVALWAMAMAVSDTILSLRRRAADGRADPSY